MEQEVSGIAEKIIQYQKKHNLTDTELALNLHITVERLHNIKSQESAPTSEETAVLNHFIGVN
ncbi:LBP_cg2779 family protein [Secundilactobacillus yichangensis]|uniref:LBP_cg2779 family protein n=1 Tax=Secundilactobacillus yichangensis TaxID=2799580 RepID=UPI0019409549|nr:LBP_cg2779 family protein [Secundilactobacillus yichangensis]